MPTANSSKPTRPGLTDDTSGSVFVEAALVLPIICVILACIVEWSLLLYQYNLLTATTGSAVRGLIMSRGFDSAPYDTVVNLYKNLGTALPIKDSDVVIRIAGEICSSNEECVSKLTNAAPASVEVTFDCTMQFTPGAASPCPLNVALTGLVE